MTESPRTEPDEDTESPAGSTDKAINDPLTRTDVEAPQVPFNSELDHEK